MLSAPWATDWGHLPEMIKGQGRVLGALNGSLSSEFVTCLE